MKKFAVLLFALFGFTVPSFAQDMKVKDGKMKMKDDKKMGKINTGNYMATYSSDFQMGNPALAQKVLDIWQDWDDNMLDRHDYMADTITMYFPDGNSMKGKAENLAAAKKYRGAYTSVKSVLHAIVPLRSNTTNQDVVAIWGDETNTHPDGKVEKRSIHEVWFFNSAGQIDTMRQWVAEVK